MNELALFSGVGGILGDIGNGQVPLCAVKAWETLNG